MVAVVYDKMRDIQMKHVIQVTVCILGIYLFRTRQSYQFTPSWRLNLDISLYANNRFPARDEILPSPIVTDLDGDGMTEIVLITADKKIQICKFRKNDAGGRRLPHLDVIYSRELPVSTAVEKNEKPVVMETGYLDQYSDNGTRSQVIVVMLNSWQVLCYDHQLVLLWQQTVLDVAPALSQYYVQSMGIMVISHKLHSIDRGLVIVGGSMINKAHAHAHRRESTANENLHNVQEDSTKEESADSTFTKFSTFALSGNNGTIKWHHLPHTATYTRDKRSEPDHHWKLSLRRGHWSQGNVHWSKFGSYLLEHTPHSWRSTKDTRFDLADIRRSDSSKTPNKPQSDASPLTDLGSDHLIGQLFGGYRPHSRHEHIENPSAVVIHYEKGLEVLSLDTGQLITRLHLEQRNAVYGDVNDDGKLDQVLVNFGGVCQGESSTIHPRPKAIFAGVICPRGWWSSPDTDSDTENTHLIVPPVLVRSVSRPRGLLNHLMGKSLPTEQIGYDSIFLTSSGAVTSFNSRGHVNWQVQTSVEWSDKTRAATERPSYINTPEGSIYQDSFRPSMLPYSLKLHAPQTYGVLLGWDNVVLLDLEDGYTAAIHSLPCQPIEPPVLADFNGDGWTDVIVTCPTGYVGMCVETQAQYVYMVVLSLTVVLCMILLSWCCQVDQPVPSSPEHE